MKRRSNSLFVNRVEILAAAALFSTGGAAIKAVLFDAWQVATLRSGIAFVTLLIAFRGAGAWWRPRVLAVGTAYAATMILYVTANKLTTAANTIFLQSTAPMYLLLLGPWVLRERVRRSDLVFTLAMGAGMALFFVGIEAPRATATDPLTGNVLAAISGLTWALTIMGLRWLGRSADGGGGAGASVVAGNLIACLAALPLALPLTSHRPVDWAVVVYLGVLQIGLAYVFMTRGMRRVGALEASLLLLLEPVLNALWAWLVHDERPGAWSLAGCAVILGSTLLRVLQHARRTRASTSG